MTRNPTAADLRHCAHVCRTDAQTTQLDKDACRRIILREGDRWDMLDKRQTALLAKAADLEEIARAAEASERMRRNAA